MNKAEAALWARAQTVEDLAALTARWLTSELSELPSYPVPVDVDDAPGMNDALATLNRAGFLTCDSQAGFDGEGADGARWRQRAGVRGFARRSVLRRIRSRLPNLYVFTTIDQPMPASERAGFRREIPVTWRNSQPTMWYGRALTREGIVDEAFPGCSAAAIDDLCGARQFTFYDAAHGDNRLWAVLRSAINNEPAEVPA